MSINNGWVSWAERIAGIGDKVWRPNRKKLYVANHSIEGYLGSADVPDRFLSLAKNPDGTYTTYAQASVTFVLHLDGTLIQMYSLEQSPWTSGSQRANEDGVPIETEGVAGELLNDAQVATYVKLIRELTPWFGFELSRAKGTIKEHHEMAQTACPSGRYQSAYDALAAPEDDMADPRTDQLIKALFGDRGQAALDAWTANGNDLTLGYALEQARLGEVEGKLDEHIANAATGVGIGLVRGDKVTLT